MPTLKEVLIAISKHQLTTIDAWQGRFVIWTAAATAGLVVVLFTLASEFAISVFFKIQSSYWWAPLILTPVAGAAITWITKNWYFGAEGSGIPQTMAALHEKIGESQYHSLLSLRLAFGKVILGVSALAAGFSAGREGPSVQVAASVMHAFRRFMPTGSSIHHKHLILAGGAAGIAAAFNTPLAGIVFAIEELGRGFEKKTNGVIITAIVLSGLVAISIQGNYTYFGRLAVGNINQTILVPVLVCGITCGFLGGIFSRTLIEAASNLPGKIGKFRNASPYLWAGFCGLLVALLGAISDGAAHGSGYTFTRGMLDGTIVETWQYAPIKYLATVFTYLSGIPGGIFAPSLSIGAGIGNDLLPLFATQHLHTTISALCMAGFLAAATQAPITSFIIVMEMIDGHEMVLSLMAVALIATLIARIITPPLYSTLAEKHVAKRVGNDS